MDRILFADDEADLRYTLVDYFSERGFAVTAVPDGDAAVTAAAQTAFDLMILDVRMPKKSGFEACREIRSFCDAPVLFLSALGEEQDLLGGYAAGGDDYIQKPYSLPVLCEKCRAMIARSRGADSDGVLTCAGIRLIPSQMKAVANGAEIVLTAKECRLLAFLMRNKNVVLSRERILASVWGYGFDGDERAVDAHIKTLRRKLGNATRAIGTVVGVGYVFREEETT